MKIRELVLFTKNVEKQKQFYSDKLELKQLEYIQQTEVSFQVGRSILKFVKRKEATPYHFAFNIFSNQESDALLWLKKRITLLTYESNEIQNFESWNAKAIYFYDEDKNIVELIARKNIKIEAKKLFNADSLLEISEIGIPNTNIEYVVNLMNSKIGLNVYSGNYEEFCAIGDEHGLFICVNPEKKNWFPVNHKPILSEFIAKIENDDKLFEVEYSNNKIQIRNVNS